MPARIAETAQYVHLVGVPPFVCGVAAMKEVVIIGAGFSALSAACYMAAAGHRVRIFEKNPVPGGRARRLERDGFQFDMGPTFYWMPDVFERFFADFGRRPGDYYRIERLDPGYAMYFADGTMLAEPAQTDALHRMFESEEPGSSRFLDRFLRSAQTNYRVAMDDIVYRPGISPAELVTPQTAARTGQFARSLAATVRRGVKSPKLRSMLEFPALFLGAKAENTPSFYRFMNYADMVLGSWHVRGGMSRAAEGIARLAGELGAETYLSSPVEAVVCGEDRAAGIRVGGETVRADIVISGADYRHTETLLPERFRNYGERYWERRRLAPSAVMFYIGFGCRLHGVAHHTLFFDTSFGKHAAAVYDAPEWPEEPLFYASFPSVTDASLAPEGCESAIILIPAAAGLTETPGIRQHYLDRILERMERLTGQELRSRMLFCESYGADGFVRDYNSYRGNAYGLANTLMQTAFLKPKVCNRRLCNMFYTGQMTVPGPGVPTALISGKIAADCALSAPGRIGK